MSKTRTGTRRHAHQAGAKQTNSRLKPGGQLRIIAGEWRGRKLPVAAVEGLRPTPDRVRETVFNWLMATVPGARCLDCFAGTGALGLEALSRGANKLVAVELSTQAATQLQANLQALKADQATLIAGNALLWLDKQATETFDLVFLDPPFRKGLLEPICQKLSDNGWLVPGSRVYIEAEAELTQLPVPANWQLIKCKQTGQVSYNVFVVPSGFGSGNP